MTYFADHIAAYLNNEPLYRNMGDSYLGLFLSYNLNWQK